MLTRGQIDGKSINEFIFVDRYQTKRCPGKNPSGVELQSKRGSQVKMIKNLIVAIYDAST